MARFLRVLLDAPEPMFSSTVRQLERMTHHQSIDIAYIADVMDRAHQVMRNIGLDPADTNELELYSALNAHADNERLFAKTDDVGLVFQKDRVISFNHDDIIENVHKPYELRTVQHMRCQMKLGFTARYVSADTDNGVAIQELVNDSGIDVCDMADYHAQKATTKTTSAPAVLCIGDIFTDVFITLLENEARIDTDRDGSKRLSLPFGSKPPYDSANIIHAVGPSPNVAVCMARLGVNVSLMGWLGDDQVGKESLKYLSREHVDVTPMTVQRKVPSNTYYVLRYRADRTILIRDQAYRYVWHAPKNIPEWIYLSLLSADSWTLHQSLADYLETHPKIKFAFQPGTFQLRWGAKKMTRLYKRAEIVIVNREEAMEITGCGGNSISRLMRGLHDLGPRYVVVTNGVDGSYASHDGHIIKVPCYPDPAPPIDRTGAGDAFAGTVVAGLVRGISLDKILKEASINSMSVVQQLGAQAGLLHLHDIEKYLKRVPEHYDIKEYSE